MFEEEKEKDSRYVVEGKKKNLTKGNEKSDRIHVGNSVTGGVYQRRLRGAALRRLVERKNSHDAANYVIIDSLPDHRTKNPLPNTISLKTMMNHQEEGKKVKPYQRKKQEAKLICLSEIQANLYLCNVDAATESDEILGCKIKTAINLTDKRITINYTNPSGRVRSGIDWDEALYYSPKIKSTREMSFQDFKALIHEASNVIENRKNYAIAIVCENGVNRGPAVAIGYAITRLGWTFERAFEYIDTVKLEKYGQWDNLTEFRLRNYLRALKKDDESIFADEQSIIDLLHWK